METVSVVRTGPHTAWYATWSAFPTTRVVGGDSGGGAARALLGLLEDLDDAPALRRGERARLHDHHAVADAGGVLLVVGLDLARAADDLAVEGVLDVVLDLDDDGLVHLVAHHVALAGLAVVAVA